MKKKSDYNDFPLYVFHQGKNFKAQEFLGAHKVEDGKYEITVYSSCCNVDKGIYYYKTYENSRITAVDMHRENLDGEAPVSYPLLREDAFLIQNA